MKRNLLIITSLVLFLSYSPISMAKEGVGHMGDGRSEGKDLSMDQGLEEGRADEAGDPGEEAHKRHQKHKHKDKDKRNE